MLGQNPDQRFIQGMFNELAPRYDLFNRLTSMGMASFWRRETLVPLRKGMRILDLGCGTGDLALAAMKKLEGQGEVVGLDFSPRMLEFAAHRQRKMGWNGSYRIRWILKRAEELPIENEPYDLVVSGFVLRNIYENIGDILQGVYRSLKRDGRISFLDITEPGNRAVKFLWEFYMSTFAELYGKLLFGKAYPSYYLIDSAKRFLKPKEFSRKLEDAGFKEVKSKSFLFGVITLYQAVKR